MKRKSTFAPYIGNVSSGTIRDEDLIAAFGSELKSLLRSCRVNRDIRKKHVALLHDCNRLTEGDDEYQYMVEELFDALEHYAPPYCYFGAHEGDGVDYGFWPSIDLHTCDEPVRLESGLQHKEHWGGDNVALVTDHGNVSVGRFDKRGRWHEYWSCV